MDRSGAELTTRVWPFGEADLVGQRRPWSPDFRQVEGRLRARPERIDGPREMTQARSPLPTRPSNRAYRAFRLSLGYPTIVNARAAPSRVDLGPQRLGADHNCTRSPPQPAPTADLVQLNRVSTTPIATRSPAHALALRDLEAFDSGGAGCRHDRSPRRPSCRTLVDLDRAVRASAPRSAALPPPVEPINGDSRESDHGGRGANSRVNLEYCLVSVSHKIYGGEADGQDELHGRQVSCGVGDPEMAKLERLGANQNCTRSRRGPPSRPILCS